MDSLQTFAWFFALLIVFLCLYYKYLTSNHDYWAKRGIPFIPGKLSILALREVFKKPFHEIEVERYEKYGRMFGFFEGRKPALTLAEPELLKNILAKDFQYFINRRDITTGDTISDNMLSILRSEKWKRVRSIISPTFSTGKIKQMTSIIVDSAKVVCQNFDESVKAGKTIDAKRLFGAFTMDVIASTAFGTKLDSHNDPDNKFVAAAKKVFSKGFSMKFLVLFFLPWLFRRLKFSIFDKEATEFFKGITLQIIEERKKTGQRRNDFLQLLLDAAEETESKPFKSESINEDANSKEEKPTFQKTLSQDEVLANCVIFFIGGYETTASALAFISYELAINPECQERVIEEIDSVLKKHEGKLTYDGIQTMKYLDNVISETLRIFPPAIRLEREVGEDYELGDTGITLPKGMIIGVPIYAMHHDPELFPDPKAFNPDRFDVDTNDYAYSYLPFGAGPRMLGICVS